MAARRKKSKTQKRIAAAAREVRKDEPAVVGKTRRKFGAKRAAAQKTAIVLSKARKAGARIPKKGRRK